MTAGRGDAAAGARAMLPLLVGVIPFGMIYGALARAAGIPAAPAQAMSVFVFAGSAQFIAVQLIGAGAPALMPLLTTAIVNLRHGLYSAALAPYLRPLPARWRWGLPYFLVDEAFAVTVRYAERGATPERAGRHLLGAGLMLWTTWQLSTAVGIFLGAKVPASWSLEFALPLTFIALVLPALGDRAGVAAAIVAGLVAAAALHLPLKLGLVTGALTGIIAGLLAERRP